jgi:hypothetical protein
MWGTTVADTSFRSADLRKSALGGVDGKKRNHFRMCDFTKADMRQTAHVSADMTGCVFSDTNLSKVDFQGTVFEDCRFEGALSEVLFCRQAFRGESFPANEMKGVDLSRAHLRYVEFRGLDMRDVRWPEGDDYVIIDDYVATLDRLLNVLKGGESVSHRKLGAILAMQRKWAGAHQRVGVLSKPDLIDVAGKQTVEELLRLVQGPNRV